MECAGGSGALKRIHLHVAIDPEQLLKLVTTAGRPVGIKELLVAGGFNAVEAEEKVYGKKAKGIGQSRAELVILRAMLDQLQPGQKELEERKAIARKLIGLGINPLEKKSGGLVTAAGAAALLGASYALASPIPALLGAGLYWFTKRSPKPEPSPVVKMSEGMANRIPPKGS
jgi:hypothetical protein